MGYFLRAENVITGLLQGNRPLLEEVIGPDDITYFANLMLEKRDPTLLQFLSELCHANGRALARNQVCRGAGCCAAVNCYTGEGSGEGEGFLGELCSANGRALARNMGLGEHAVYNRLLIRREGGFFLSLCVRP
jgi:hypothetical protein